MKPLTPWTTPDEVRALWRRRYTAKALDPSRRVGDDELDAILTSAHLSASSMGMEPWHFVVLTPGPLFEAVTTHCWGYHPQASHLIVLLGRNASHFLTPGDYVRHIHVDVQGRDADSVEERGARLLALLREDLGLVSDDAVTGWVDRQVFIALGSMLASAAMLGVDSTAIEGLDARAVSGALVDAGAFNPDDYHVVCALALGYTSRAHHRAKTRRDIAEVVTHL